MSLGCIFGLHTLEGCICKNCGKEIHNWNSDGDCNRCNKINYEIKYSHKARIKKLTVKLNAPRHQMKPESNSLDKKSLEKRLQTTRQAAQNSLNSYFIERQIEDLKYMSGKAPFKCKIGFHNWNKCTCKNCGKIRNIEHTWDKCTCKICGAVREIEHNWSKDCEVCDKCGFNRENEHKWNGCTCEICGKVRDEQHNWDKNDCSRCLTCNKVDEVRHNWNGGCVCSTCKINRNKSHTYENKSCRCTKCGRINHNFNNGTCQRCGEAKEEPQMIHLGSGRAVESESDIKINIDDSQFERLSNDLKNPDQEVRARACVELGTLSGKRCVDLLIEALSDRHEFVGKSAAKSLGKIGDNRAIAPLERAQKQHDRLLVAVSAKDALIALRARGITEKPIEQPINFIMITQNKKRLSHSDICTVFEYTDQQLRDKAFKTISQKFTLSHLERRTKSSAMYQYWIVTTYSDMDEVYKHLESSKCTPRATENPYYYGALDGSVED